MGPFNLISDHAHFGMLSEVIHSLFESKIANMKTVLVLVFILEVKMGTIVGLIYGRDGLYEGGVCAIQAFSWKHSQEAAYKVQIRVRNDGLDASRFKARFASSQNNARTVSLKRGDSGNVVADLALEYENVKV
jgi:hypothetical protein